MIVTVTPNTAIDRTLFLPYFEWNKTIRASRSYTGMGGKAADASWVLGEMGIPNLAMGFAAGYIGEQMEKMLQSRGSRTDFVWVGGETRINTVVIDEGGHGQSTLVTGELHVSPEHVAELRARFRAALQEATCVLLGGSLPAGVNTSLYTEMVAEARAASLPVVFDASGPGLLAGVKGCPTVCKPNRDELQELVGKRIDSLDEVYAAARELQERYNTAFVVTLGAEGALAVLPECSYFIPPPPVQVVSSAGAGDGVLAGLCAALGRGEPLEAGLRLGFAAAGAVCLTPITADCHREDIERLLPTIQLVPYNPLVNRRPS